MKLRHGKCVPIGPSSTDRQTYTHEHTDILASLSCNHSSNKLWEKILFKKKLSKIIHLTYTVDK